VVSNHPSQQSIWFKVCSRSSLPPPTPAPRWRPASVVNEDDARRIFSWHCQTCRERAAHNEHLNKVGTGNRKNGTFTGNTLGEQRLVLPVPEMTKSKPRECDRLSVSGTSPDQEIDHLLDFFLCLVAACHVSK
jgi:hypothetical protein